MNENDLGSASDIEALASLGEPVRRALYAFVAGSANPVSRDEVANAVDVSRQVAAYHLNRLAEDGLLEVENRRLSGKTGPGAGRPSKLYRRSDRVHEVSIPPRRYELAARILLDATREGHFDAGALIDAARRTGREIGQAGLGAALEATGYEPVTEEGETRFRNCPFHVLRDRDRDTTCGLSLALVEGMVEGSGSKTDAVLAREEGYCCVRLSPPVSQ
ncbi:MAG TPA: helix-turn-helix domain-containing protein [Acidimicrobiia bacterium]|nr:helix-turn-helix domain-containing protein [Acidimicrobiia bacterium]